MKGEFVICRAHEGPLIRRVVEAEQGVMWIASEAEYNKAIRGLPHLEPVGFKASDVFRYTPEIAMEVESGQIKWEKLTPYQAPPSGRQSAHSAPEKRGSKGL